MQKTSSLLVYGSHKRMVWMRNSFISMGMSTAELWWVWPFWVGLKHHRAVQQLPRALRIAAPIDTHRQQAIGQCLHIDSCQLRLVWQLPAHLMALRTTDKTLR